MGRQVVATVAALVVGWPSAAWACGGFFCNNQPVDQSGENIVFAIDTEAEQVTAHVQIQYAGSAEDFAWVVPVAGIPELFVSTEQLFTELGWRTAPQFNVEIQEVGDCTGYWYGGYTLDYAASSSGGYADTGAPGGVVVIAEQEIGPYETVTLQADSSAALLEWLQTNGYDLPDTLDPVLSPYVAGGNYFVALRLQNDKDVGDLAPLGMKYAGTQASVPIQLTSIAATPDMRLHVWVFADERAVPASYLHVQINEAAIDWTERGDNYEDVITVAADEAGGHAFATDMAGSTQPLRNTLYTDGRYDTAALATHTDPAAFMSEVIYQGFPANSTLLNLLLAYMPPPAGVDPTTFYNCVSCYPDHVAELDFDAAGLAAAIQEVIVTPLIEVEAMFAKHDFVSRMTSSLSPAEMTVDPTFVLNADMGAVEAVREATLVYECPDGEDFSEANRRLLLADGRVMDLPSDLWLESQGLTYEDYVEGATSHFALVIEQTGASGQPEPLSDYSDEPMPTDPSTPGGAEATPTAEEWSGCACQHGGAMGGLWLAAVAGLLVRRRR